MNALSKMSAIIIAILLLFLFPLLYLAQKQDAVTQAYISETTGNLVDAIKNSGYLTTDMYDEFIRKIDLSNNVYEVKIEHSHWVLTPIYDASDQFTGDYNKYRINTYEDDILEEIYHGSGIYKLTQGDYIVFTVYNKNKTFASRLQENIYQTAMEGKQIFTTYGGVIRDENY